MELGQGNRLGCIGEWNDSFHGAREGGCPAGANLRRDADKDGRQRVFAIGPRANVVPFRTVSVVLKMSLDGFLRLPISNSFHDHTSTGINPPDGYHTADIKRRTYDLSRLPCFTFKYITLHTSDYPSLNFYIHCLLSIHFPSTTSKIY